MDEISRQHEMVASHDRVLTAIREALQQLAARQLQNIKPRAANLLLYQVVWERFLLKTNKLLGSFGKIQGTALLDAAEPCQCRLARG